MPSLLSTRRAAAGVSLRATPARKRSGQTTRAQSVSPPISWPLMAVVGGAVTALASWILCAGVTVVGWLAAEPGSLEDALRVGTLLWLLSNGVGVRLGEIPVTLVPWGATAVIAFMISRFAALSARKVRTRQTTGPGLISVVTVAAYLLSVLVGAMLWGEPWQAPARWAVVIAVLLGAAWWGSSRSLGIRRVEMPGRVRAIIRAVSAAQLAMLVAGAAVLVTALWTHLKQVETLHQALQPGVAGGIALLLLQLAFVPNALIWSAAYALGSGFSLGADSVIAPAATQLGMVPGIPLLGALPSPGPGDITQLWWLATGAVAGAIACWVVLSFGQVPRFDQASLTGGVCGLLAGAVFAGLAWAASGDMGTLRLADLGPRLFPLLVMAGTTMGLSGLVTGLALGWAARAGR
jgi:Family of unknown function (DUF6350)